MSDLMRIMDDIDVYDDVCEELGIAFCNPFDDDDAHDWDEYLTEYGMNTFGEVLDYPMEIYPYDCGMDMPCAVIGIDDEEGVWQKKCERQCDSSMLAQDTLIAMNTKNYLRFKKGANIK